MNPIANILVIDDEKGLRDWLSFELGQQGYIVVTAQNGKEGIEKIKKEKFDVAIIDIKMPEMDGITALSQIKKIDPNIEIIISMFHLTFHLSREFIGFCCKFLNLL